ncbi:MAG: beta-phosphoglucomutase [Lactobacillaceae bacterium]|jgi:beta-phosphoglucomutase|nr:beta-phosphoglucomutase [Lactobacillaceae bacterium]
MIRFEEIKGFAFDLDGVIADTARFHEEAWHQTADTVGTIWTDELAEALKGISRMDSLEMILAHGQHPQKYSLVEKEQLADEKNINYQKLIATLTPADILPGMLEFIESAHAAGYQMAVASASKNAPMILEHLGLIQYFEGIVDPSTLQAGKPNPEIFVRAAEILHLTPEQVIGLEDSSAGIEAINAAGELSLGIGSVDVLSAAELNFVDTKEVTLTAIQQKMNA